jgi:oxygen-independent coproporphyrinogen-3 oxidase
MPADHALPQAKAPPGGSNGAIASSRELFASLAGLGPVRSLYIHVPFCFHKCHYCDFYSIVDTRDRQDAFVERLSRELVALAPLAAGAPLRTIFVGGGTPSLLATHLWERLLETLHANFDLSAMRSQGPSDVGEFTVECNPETVSSELMRVLRDGCVTRVSIGAQSFHAQHLQTLERWHDPANVAKAVALAREAGIARQSLDLIYAIPGQTQDDLDRDLDAALSLATEHLSCYALTYEPNTAMAVRMKRGEFRPADEDLEASMFERVLDRLRAAGLDRYEVSNFATPGGECRHNLAYWRQDDWLAAGPSASGHVRGWRWKNTTRLDDYLSHEDGGFARVQDVESPDPRRNLAEALWTGLRTREGVDARAMLARAHAIDPAMPSRLERVAQRQVSLGAFSDQSGRWTLTDPGMLVADSIAVEFMRAVD